MSRNETLRHVNDPRVSRTRDTYFVTLEDLLFVV